MVKFTLNSPTMYKSFLLALFFSCVAVLASAQKVASIYGVVKDKNDASTLPGVNVIIKGTTVGVSTDENGKFQLNLKPGTYNVEFTFIGYETVLYTAIKLKAEEKKEINVLLKESVTTFGKDVVIVGEKPMVEIEVPKTIQTVDRARIEEQPVRQIQNIINTQAGVINTPSGVHIRGGRTYETGFLIDGVSARDPLAGTGFGVDIGSNALDEIDITTGGVGAEYGDATTGVVNAKTRSGGEKTEFSLLYKRDNFGFNREWNSVFNEEVLELGVGGPIKRLSKITKGKWNYFTSLRYFASDLYTKNPPEQLVSSIFPNAFWTPRQDNRWAGLLKLDYALSSTRKFSLTYNKTISANQDVNMLRITGNDVPFVPGYQWAFALQPDRANTFTNSGNLLVLNYSDASKKRFAYNITASRLFSRLRADANGRPWRPSEVDSEFDPATIVVAPISYFNSGDSIVAVNPPPGLFNNNGIATLWHDHFYEEITTRFSGNLYSKNALNRLNFGVEFKFQDMQWIDINRPWIGAPIRLADGTSTQSFRLGDYSAAWRVKPSRGGIWASEKIKYKGLVADIGARLEYWMPGKFVDDAIANPKAQIRDEIREEYKKQTLNLFGRGFKFRFLPKISAAFPILENQMLFFNYGHATILPHPSFIYSGLDPFYSDRSTAARLGNPNLNPEVSISYELGLKSQITSNDVLSVSAFYRDNYDFVTTTTILVKDVTGRESNRSMSINSDYARVRGLETSYQKRIKNWFSAQLSVTYMQVTGQSASASESLKEILSAGNREDTREFNLPWGTPLDLKGNAVFTLNNKDGFLGKKWLNQMAFYFEFVYRSGFRYTPYNLSGFEDVTNRPIYIKEQDQTKQWSALGNPVWWIDFNYRKWWTLKKVRLAWTVEITNLLNIQNTSRINPVTGRAWQSGDAVPTEWRDPNYLDPRDARSYALPPDDPSRFMQQRHFLTGLQVKF